MDYSHLLYKRGYLFSEVEVEPPITAWTRKTIGDYFISFDPENPWAFSQKDSSWVAILGRVIDTLYWGMDINSISRKCLGELSLSEESLLDYIDHLSGRFIIIYHHGNRTKFMTDAFGTRSAFYSLQGLVVIASHCSIIGDYLNSSECTRMETIKRDQRWLTVSGRAYPGILTPDEGVYVLTPNTLINIEEKKIQRYYPRRNLSVGKLSDVVEEVSVMLEKQLDLLHGTYNLVISLTAGIDTRTTLAAARNLVKDIVFFTYGDMGYLDLDDTGSNLSSILSGMADDKSVRSIVQSYERRQRVLKTDTLTASEIAEALELHHICLADAATYGKSDEELSAVLARNSYHAHGRRLAKAYLDQLPSNALHIRSSTGEVAKSYYRKVGFNELPLTEQVMAHVYRRMGDNEKVVGAFSEFIEVTEFAKIMNYDPYDMFYWEHRDGTWLSCVLLESDIAFDTFELFNCRALMEKIMSIPTERRVKSVIHMGIIRSLWPVLLQWPVNKPPFRLQLEELQEKIDKQVRNLAKQTNEFKKQKRTVQTIKSSFSYQLGTMLVQAVRKPGRNTMFLPYRLIRVCYAEFKKQKTVAAKGGKYTEVRLADVTLSACTATIKKKYVECFGVDSNRYGGYLETDWRRIEYISSLLPEAKSVLDVGMGNGAFLNLVMSLNRSQRVLGIDIRRHSKFIMVFESQLYQIIYGSITNLPFADKSIDIVTCMEVLEHLDKQSFLAALPELRRVSRFLVVTVPYNEPEPMPSYHKLRFTDSDLSAYFPQGEFILLKKGTGNAWMAIVERL